MNRPDRMGVTLADVVVVTVIVVIAIVLLVPLLNGRRIAARRDFCMNNQLLLGAALLSYEAQHKQFPGYANRIGKDDLPTSWVPPVFSYLGREDLAVQWNSGEGKGIYLHQMVCPSAMPAPVKTDIASLGYVVNCGLPGDDDTLATAVFFNHAGGRKQPTMTAAYLKDHHAQETKLLLSENLQAGYWTDTSEADVGMTWLRTPGKCSPIDACRDVGPRPQDIQYARPSSNHAGGVNATFCDGHNKFLSDKIEYRVYQYLMAPDSEAAGLVDKAP